MCYYSEVLGGGGVLVLQLLTIVSIIASIMVWIWFYLKNGLEKELWEYAPPIVLWVIFGTLDIVITAKGTYLDPMNEGNPLARVIFVETGYIGPVVASILWISLWSVIVLAINKAKVNGAGFLSLAVFWSLVAGHFYGFSSWFDPFCGFAESYLAFFYGTPPFLKAIVLGFFLAMIHYSTMRKERFESK
jgi:hypothetical protein